MRTLELKDICGYLPYGLKAQYSNNQTQDVITDVVNMPDNDDIKLTIGYIGSGEHIWMYKPILRPLSDLYRAITHNGEEIVPIVECAKISISNENWKLKDECAFLKFNGMSFVFNTDEDGGFFVTIRSAPLVPLCAPNQFKLFDFLHELKIDYRGLIDDGLAIDANTLENNPYKS
jgi:hypothetical protein